jgi:hypothetical protein
MSDGYDLKLLFGAGYAGLQKEDFGNAYPPYDYMKPQKGFDSEYGDFLQAYYEPFETFCTAVANYILAPGRKQLREYARRWMHYNHAHVLGFPDCEQLDKPGILATAMAIYMWDCSISHAVDHANYAWCVTSKERCLRIRIPPPKAADQPPPLRDGEPLDLAGNIATVDDYARSEMCTWMFFKPWTIKPNLLETLYAFTDMELVQAAKQFKQALLDVSKRTDIHQFMPLEAYKPRKGRCAHDLPRAEGSTDIANPVLTAGGDRSPATSPAICCTRAAVVSGGADKPVARCHPRPRHGTTGIRNRRYRGPRIGAIGLWAWSAPPGAPPRHLALITEDFDGQSLEHRLTARGLDLPAAGCPCLAEGLARLHAGGLLHRDIRPGKILFHPALGSRFIELDRGARLHRESERVRALDPLEGDLRYCAPEQIGRIDAPVHDAADLYSLGATLFHVASGRAPFDAADPAVLAHSLVTVEAPLLSELNAEIRASTRASASCCTKSRRALRQRRWPGARPRRCRDEYAAAGISDFPLGSATSRRSSDCRTAVRPLGQCAELTARWGSRWRAAAWCRSAAAACKTRLAEELRAQSMASRCVTAPASSTSSTRIVLTGVHPGAAPSAARPARRPMPAWRTGANALHRPWASRVVC